MRWAEEEGGAEATKLGETVCLLLLIRLSQRLFQRRSTKCTLHTEGASQLVGNARLVLGLELLSEVVLRSWPRRKHN